MIKIQQNTHQSLIMLFGRPTPTFHEKKEKKTTKVDVTAYKDDVDHSFHFISLVLIFERVIKSFRFLLDVLLRYSMTHLLPSIQPCCLSRDLETRGIKVKHLMFKLLVYKFVFY